MKIDLTGIKNIIFDLGNVLLNLDLNASIKAFYELGSSNEVLDHKNAYADIAFYNLETGRISPKDFCNRVREMLKNPSVTDKQIEDAWYAMILDIPVNRVKVVQQLSKKYNVYLFSNTNKIHIDRLLTEFKSQHGIAFESLFNEVFYSYVINERKPDVISYKKVIEQAGVDPRETIFIDDLEKNITGAEQAGLKTFWLKNGMEMAGLF